MIKTTNNRHIHILRGNAIQYIKNTKALLQTYYIQTEIEHAQFGLKKTNNNTIKVVEA